MTPCTRRHRPGRSGRRHRAFLEPLVGAIVLGLSLNLLPTAAQTGRGAAPSVSAIYVESLLTAKDTRRSGFAMYLARSLSVGKTVFPHALITEVGGAGSSQTLSILTLNLEGVTSGSRHP